MVTEADPRERQDGLGWVTRAIFGDPGVRVAVGDDPAATVRYAVIPSLDDARFLLPLASRKVTAASLLAYNALRPPKVRAGRAAVGLLARAGALGLTRAPILSVYADAPGLLLAGFLAAELGEPELHAAIGIRPPDPHHKPTLQLFDGGGRPRGYAKIGWNDGTRAMVRAEAATLADLPVGNGFPPAPKLMLHTRWNGREIAVIAPMPRRVRRIRRPGTPRLAAMLAVARRGGPPAPPRPARDLVAGWLGRAEGGDPRIHAVIGSAGPGPGARVRRLARRLGAVEHGPARSPPAGLGLGEQRTRSAGRLRPGTPGVPDRPVDARAARGRVRDGRRRGAAPARPGAGP
nr:hypothetical protein GCM10020092_023800 [Actinoplanes digitatis]